MIGLEKLGNTLVLAGTLSGADVLEAHALLLAECGSPDAASLDLSGVEAIDTRGVQLIASFLRTREGNLVSAVSAPVEAFISRIGALSLLGTQP